jgi:hypothetical protein
MDGMNLELNALDNFTGTEQYHNVLLGINATDGIKYVMENGYSWFVTDTVMIVIMEKAVKAEDFVKISLEVKDGKATVIYTDGDNRELYRQKYELTDAKRSFSIYYDRASNVMLLPSEY